MLKSEVLLPQMAVFVLDCPMRLRRCFAQILFNFSCHKSLYTFYLHRRVLHCMLLIALTPPPVELVLLYDIARSLWHMLSVEETRNALLTHEYGLPALWMMLKSTIDPILALTGLILHSFDLSIFPIVSHSTLFQMSNLCLAATPTLPMHVTQRRARS
jgi:hypothetical protein